MRMPSRKRHRECSAEKAAAGSHEALEVVYAAWLRERGAWWLEADVATSNIGVVAGWGVLARRPLRRGTVLFSIPREACFGAHSKKVGLSPSGGDTQARLARCLLSERDKGSDSSWAPLLNMLTPALCPVTWPRGTSCYLDGTELQPVLERKHQRLRTERAASKHARRWSATEYASACALAMSHINPWFGGSIVPFNTTLNWSERPNVEFDVDEGGAPRVIGRATRDIAVGEELTQECAPTTAELIYRYGFAPTIDEVLGTGEGASSSGLARKGSGQAAAQGCGARDEDVVSISFEQIVAACGADKMAPVRRGRRRKLLCAAGALDSSPWDGLDALVTVELQLNGSGLAKLLGACLALCADDSIWAAAEAATLKVAPNAFECEECEEASDEEASAEEASDEEASAEEASDEEASAEEASDEEASDEEASADDDQIAAALVSALSSASATVVSALKGIAVTEGGEDADPWPALLDRAPLHAKIIDRVRAAAKRATHARLDALGSATLPVVAPSDTGRALAWDAAMALRRVESGILHGALDALSRWRQGSDRVGEHAPSVRKGRGSSSRNAPGAAMQPSAAPPPSAPPSPSSSPVPPAMLSSTSGVPPAREINPSNESQAADAGGGSDLAAPALAADEIPSVLFNLLSNAREPGSVGVDGITEALPFLPLGMPLGRATDVSTLRRLLDAPSCAALRSAVDQRHDTQMDTVDGQADHQLNLDVDGLLDLVGAEQVEAIRAAARALDVRTGGSGERALPITEAFVRRYAPDARPWHPFHQDRAYVTVNVALSDDCAHAGGRLLGLFADGAAAFERMAGDATVHLSRIVHGVSRMEDGMRYSLIVFLGDEPAVRRKMVREMGPNGEPQETWTRVIVEE